MSNSESSRLTIVIAGGKTYVGKFISCANRLDDALELISGMVQTREGHGIVTQCAPILMFASLRSIEVPRESIFVDVNDLDPSEQKAVRDAVRSGEEMCNGIRASRSGVVVAPASAIKNASRLVTK